MRNVSIKSYKACLKRHGNVAQQAEPETAMELLPRINFFSVLKDLQTGISSGSDGLLSELYLAFWNVPGDKLIFVLNEQRPWCSIRYSM